LPPLDTTVWAPVAGSTRNSVPLLTSLTIRLPSGWRAIPGGAENMSPEDTGV